MDAANENNTVEIDFPNTEWERWEKTGANGRVKLVHSSGTRFRILELPAGFDEEHWCEKGHVGYVFEGEFIIQFKDREVICGPGMAFNIPDGDPHRSRGLENGPTVVFVVD